MRVQTPAGLGTVRFRGTTDFAVQCAPTCSLRFGFDMFARIVCICQVGEWVGVELDTRQGRHDGTVKSKRYFSCSEGHGIFVRAEALQQC